MILKRKNAASESRMKTPAKMMALDCVVCQNTAGTMDRPDRLNTKRRNAVNKETAI